VLVVAMVTKVHDRSQKTQYVDHNIPSMFNGIMEPKSFSAVMARKTTSGAE